MTILSADGLSREASHWLMQQELAEFLYAEADLLDTRQFSEWLNMLADDLVYFMPIRRNVKFGQHDEKENTLCGEGISWFDEDKWTLTKRVEQILTGLHFAEEPLSRVSHLVTNVRLVGLSEDGQEASVRSRFLVYQNRQDYETNIFVGKRNDVLRKSNGSWLIAKREIILDQSTLLAKALTVFF